ncbi:hypothetical protein [Microbacterium oxydans]|uniref:hypothetical protein n=1 Tax=Microbacterium oxydans TaxID=82380 RepID=UPI0037C54469
MPDDDCSHAVTQPSLQIERVGWVPHLPPCELATTVDKCIAGLDQSPAIAIDFGSGERDVKAI